MGEIGAAGEIVTGALLGRAVEPHAGESGGEGDACLNCGTALVGPHCHRCGQSAHVHRSLGGIGHELLHGVLHFEGKLWRTLPMLAWSPGKLTRRYIEGERARFVSPIALFLFSIFTLFAVFSLFGLTPQGVGSVKTMTPQAKAELRAGFVRERDDAARQLATMTPGGRPARIVEATVHELDATIGRIDRGEPLTGPIASDIDFKTGWERLDHGIEKAIENPSLTSYKLQSNSYKFSWLLIPLSLPFVWLMFAWRREFRLYDHAVFVTYSIAFMSLLFIAGTLLGALGIPGSAVRLAMVVIVPVHLFRQLRHAYRLSWPGALVRTILLLLVILLVVVLFLAIVLALGVLG